MNFTVVTLGCKANQYDSAEMTDILRSRGHEHINPGDGCDVCIINTCAVTTESVRKSRQAVRRVKKQEPKALIAVCGCFSQLDTDAASALGADIIGGTSDREAFVDEIERNLRSQLSDLNCQLPIVNSQISTLNPIRTRALLKIQDGCDNRCAYCIIPKARGNSRSVPLDELADKAKKLQQRDYKEIILTGVEISAYKPSLIDAIGTVRKNAPGVRIRLGSLDPDILTDEFIERMKKIPDLCEHFHISLQSGCDGTLSRMLRRYNTSKVAAAVNSLRESFNNCAVTADLITGFPGETDDEFEKTLAFIEKSSFSSMHIFPYSKRPGTIAETLPAQIPNHIKKERARKASAIAMQMNMAFKSAQIGKTSEVLFETYKNKQSMGYSRNYLTVAVNKKIKKNTIQNIKIISINNGTLYGEIV